jgi:phosphate transport system substrate-binding protein
MTSMTITSAQEQVRIGGTGGALAVMKRLASAFQRSHPGVAITVLPSLGSAGGIKAVLAGALDLGVSSRPPNILEKGAVSHVIGRTPFVFAVRRDNPVSDLTLGEIEAIYAGRTRSWPDGRPLRVVLRPEAETDTSLLKSMSPAMERIIADALLREGMIMAVTDQDNARAIERVPGAVGTTTLAQVLSEGLPFKALSLDGVRPGPGTLVSGAYPYFKTYYLITAPGSRPVVRQFVDFITSPRGRSVLSRCGYQAIR